MRVTQILCAAGPVDAVTNQGLACRSLFSRWGWSGEDFAAVIAPGVPRHVMRPLHELGSRNGDILLLHYSGYARGLERLLDCRRSLLISHNITPARYFWAYEPVEGVRCQLAQGQLAELARSFGALAGVSNYNARELMELSAREADVIPVLFDRSSLAPAGQEPSGPPTILFVGRLVPHKRQDLVIRAFARYRRRQPDARLVLVGVPLSPEYEVQLRSLADELAPGAVTFESGISSERLAEHYRRAHAFLCLSEHEGFCIPLLEAFHFGLPVIARSAAGVPEVAGNAALLLDDAADLAVVAELLHLALTDRGLRDELRRRAEARLEVYAYERTARKLQETMQRMAPS